MKNITRQTRKLLVLLLKSIIFIILEVILFFYLLRTIPGFALYDIHTAFITIILLSVFNLLLWPLISYYTLDFLVSTFGFGTFLLNGVMLWIISKFISGITIQGSALFTVPLLLGLINSAISVVLSIDADNTYYNYILKKELERNNNSCSEKPGFIFMEIDGLARPILDKALKRGDMPTLEKWLKDGSHKLTTWETDLSSQTGVSQAGILHGHNDNMPAFRWVEKEHGNKIVSSNNFKDSAMLEKRISDGDGLLSYNGASRANLFSGDASDVILTCSKFSRIKNLYTKTWYYLYSSPYNFARIMLLFLWDFVLELASQIRQIIKNIKPRLIRKPSYLVARAGANVVLREVTTFSLIGDIFKGEYNVIYATYMGYDEIAHHSGIEDYDAFFALRQIDKQFQHIQRSIKESKRKYYLTVLSDHGQSGGPTFKQKYGITLEQLVKNNLPDNISVHSILYSNEDHLNDQISIKNYAEEQTQKIDDKFDETVDYIKNTETVVYLKNMETIDQIKKVKHKAFNKFRENESIQDKIFLNNEIPLVERINDLSKEYGIGVKLSKKTVLKNKTAQTIVLASGNLGLIYFTDWNVRLTYEQIEDSFPSLIHGLINHPGIGFIMVKSALYGTVVMSKDSVYYLDTDTYKGENPLKDFGHNVVDHLKRTDSYKYAPDILVNSSYDKDTNEVYAFEELIGSHGGVGGTQTEPFILYPSNWTLNNKIIGAESVNKFFKREMEKVWKEEEN